MADRYWSGLGVADGTTISTGNIATTGNTDADGATYIVAYAPSGSPTSVYSRAAQPMGPGASITGPATSVARIDVTHPAARGGACQILYTPSGATTTANNSILTCRSNNDTAFAAFLDHSTSSTFLVANSGHTTVTGGTSPTITNGNTYLIDMLVDLNSGTPSTTNGRIVVRVINLSDPTWNTTGEWFVDTGYTVNVGTTQPNKWRIGKAASGAVTAQTYYTGIRWGDRVAMNTTVDPTIARQQFIQPVVATTVIANQAALVRGNTW